MRSWMIYGLCAAGGLVSAGRVDAQSPKDQAEPGRPVPRISRGVPPANRPHIPGPDEPGPWDQDVLVYRANAAGAPEKLATFERSGVPTLARLKDGRLIAAAQHFPKDDVAGFDKVAVRFSTDDGKTWTAPKVIAMDGLPADMRFPFDPTLVPLPDGRVRMYFTSRHQGPPKPGAEGDPPAIYSGTSEDGVKFVMEPGVRFAVEGRFVIDCAVALHEGKFHLFAPDNGKGNPEPGPNDRGRRDRGVQQDGPREGVGYHAVSEDGLKFTRLEDVRIEGRGRWLGCAMSIAGEKETGAAMVFVGSGGGGPKPRAAEPNGDGKPGSMPGQGEQPNKPSPAPMPGGIWMAQSTDGKTWKMMDPPRVPGADPGAGKLADGSWLFVVTGEPREGTASARRRGQRPEQR